MQERTKTSDIPTDSETKCHHVAMISSYCFPTFMSEFNIKLYAVGDQNDKYFFLRSAEDSGNTGNEVEEMARFSYF